MSAEPVRAVAGPVRQVDHVAVAVRDTDAALPYFTGALGLTVVGDEYAPAPGVRLTYLDGGNVVLQLVCPHRDGPVATFLAEQGEGLHHVCFAVNDLEDSLTGLGGEPSAVFPGGRGRRCAFLPDRPSGVRIELTEWQPRP